MSNYGLISMILQQKGKDVWSIAEDATVFQALKLMSEKNVGALLVMRGRKPVGILSERDYAVRILTGTITIGDLQHRSIVTRPIVIECPDVSL